MQWAVPKTYYSPRPLSRLYFIQHCDRSDITETTDPSPYAVKMPFTVHISRFVLQLKNQTNSHDVLFFTVQTSNLTVIHYTWWHGFRISQRLMHIWTSISPETADNQTFGISEASQTQHVASKREINFDVPPRPNVKWQCYTQEMEDRRDCKVRGVS